MYFKSKGLAVLLASVLALQGCGLSVGEKPTPAATPSFSGRGYSCVGQIPQHLQAYASDELSETQITDFVRCLQKAFTTFTQLTRGRDESVYTPDEIRRFLQTYFLRERPITDKLLSEFMVLKQVVIGGRLDQITRPEISRWIEILEDIRVEAIRLKPHIKFLNPRLVLDQDPVTLGDNLKTANEALKESIRVFSARLKKGTRDYPFEDMEVLMDEFRTFVRWDEHFPDAHPSKSWINLFKVFKSASVTPLNPDVMRTVDWRPFLENFTRWYLAFMEYRVGIQNQPKLYGVGLQNTLHLGQEVFGLMEESINRQSGKVLTMTQMSNLVAAAQDLNWLTPGVRSISVEKTLRALLERVFADENGQAKNPRSTEGLTLKTLALMKYEFYRWAYIQMQLNSRYTGETAVQSSQAAPVPNLQTNFFIPLDVRNKLKDIRDADWEHFLKIRKLARPLFNDNLARVTLVPDGELSRFHLSHEFNNLSMMNVLRSAVGLLFRGYATEKGLKDWDTGLKSSELQAFYEDVRDLAIDLGVADRRVVNTGARAFVEGNLFTYAAGGIDANIEKSRLSYVEAMELLAFLYSGGKMSTDFFARLEGHDNGQPGCAEGPNDLNGDPTFDRKCVHELMPSLIGEFSANLPGLVDYLGRTSTENKTIFVNNIIQTAFSPVNSSPQWVERSELAIMAVVLHYLEAVLTRFDTDQNGVLDKYEIRKAIPVFTGYIQKFAKEQMNTTLSEKEAEGVFLYILAYKTIPSKWNIIKVYDLAMDLYWEFEVPWVGAKIKLDLNQEISLDRTELSKVFVAIVSKIFSATPNAASLKK